MGVYIWTDATPTPPSTMVFYYPFKQDLNDYSGNGWDLTASVPYGGTIDYSFTTNTQGIECMALNTNRKSTQLKVNNASQTYPTVDLTQSGTFGFYICDWVGTGVSVIYGGIGGLLTINNVEGAMGVLNTNDTGKYGIVVDGLRFDTVSGSSQIILDIRDQYLCIGPSFVKYILTWDYPNKTITIYANDVKIYERSGDITGFGQNEFIIGRDDWGRESGFKFFAGKLCNFVYSTGIWGAPEMARFYNLN